MVLTKMKETAEAYLGHEVKDAVVTVPAVSFIFSLSFVWTRENLERSIWYDETWLRHQMNR